MPEPASGCAEPVHLGRTAAPSCAPRGSRRARCGARLLRCLAFEGLAYPALVRLTGETALGPVDAAGEDVFVTLRAFAPDGTEVDFQGALDPHTPLAQGWLRASHRKLDPQLSTDYRPYHTHDSAESLTPGDVYQLDIELWPTCVVLPAGYRIALTVQGKDFERATAAAQPASFVNPFRGSGPFTHTNLADRPASIFGGTHTLHTGPDHESYVLLPFIPGGEA